MRHHIKTGSATIVLVLIFTMLMTSGVLAADHRPYTITHMVTRFGTPQYTEGTALEEVFRKSGSWIQWKAQETPGAMYINKYIFQNLAKMKAGEAPVIVTSASASIMPWFIEGRPPFKKIPLPDSRALFSTSSWITVFLTFDKNIKSTRDFVGKKVGIPEKSRPFMSTLPLKPYFGKGLGIWKKVDWQYIGPMNSKDALLNDRIDVSVATFMGKAEKDADGNFVCRWAAPLPPEMEIMNSGRAFNVVPFDPKVVEKSYDFSKDMRLYPVLIKKGAIKGIDKDVWGLLANGLIRVALPLPRDVVKEVIRVRYKYRKELAKFHAALSFYPENPYPVGVPESWVNPGVKEAVEALGFKVK